MSFKDCEFDLSENRGLVLVSGRNLDVPDSRNAVGKSSLFSAILYGMFGQLQYPIKNVNLKNRYVQEREMYVEVEFSVAGKDTYVIRRSLNKRNQTALTLHKLNKKTGEWEDQTKFSIAETDDYVQKEVIQCDISIFLRTVFLSSDQTYNFFKLTPSEKRNFIEKLFNISIFGDMYTLIHRDILSMDKEIMAKQSVLVALNRNIEECTTHLETFMTDREKQLMELEASIAQYEESRKQLSTELEKDNSEEIAKIKVALDKIKTTKETLVKKIRKIQSDERELSVAIARIGSSVEAKQKIIDEHQVLLSKLCKDCRPIAEDHYKIGELMKEIFEKRAESAISEAKKKELTDTISKMQEKSDALETKYAKLTDKLSKILEKINKKRLELQRLETNISNLSVNFEDLKEKKNPYEDIIASNKKRIDDQNKELADISEQYKYLKFAENIVNTDTLKKFIIKDLITLLNAKIKFYLSRLGGNFECKFDENMDVSFLTPGGKCDYANFSSGEQMRLMIASCFAFKDFMQTRNNFCSNILILDEFIDSGIDTLAINGVFKIFEDFKKIDSQSIYVISHRIDDMDNYPFDNMVRITKENNISDFEVIKVNK